MKQATTDSGIFCPQQKDPRRFSLIEHMISSARQSVIIIADDDAVMVNDASNDLEILSYGM